MANDSINPMSGEELVEMRNQPYDSEDVLQELSPSTLTCWRAGR